LISAQGTRFQLNELQAVLQGIQTLREPSLEYQVVQPDGSNKPLVIRVEIASADPSAREIAVEECVKRCKDELSINVSVEVLERDTIPRAGYKATRIVES
jgi:phenylacetate-coenzyme A ligase PaaK-like adenylate-forming protein